MTPVLLALCSNVSFATASLFFTEYSRKYSAEWVNYYKALVAFLCFVLVTFVFQLHIDLSNQSLLFLSLSGALGLFIGDIFLLKAFTHLGPGRVLMLFGFEPLILGVASFYLFGQSFSFYRIIAVVLLIGCLFTFSLESFRQKGHWDLKGLLYALIGVTLDAAGILLTKATFEMNADLSPFYANVYRSGITVFCFLIMSQIPWFRLSLLAPLKQFQMKEKVKITFACFLGTFVSLGFYLMAMKDGHLATISAVAGTSPLFATLFETLTGRKKATIYLFVGIGFFISGMIVLSVF